MAEHGRLIDANALMEKLDIAYSCTNCKHADGVCCNKGSYFVDACEEICTAPTIEPERKTGKWEKHKTALIHWYRCSECGEGLYWEANFCPNCGSYNGGEQP